MKAIAFGLGTMIIVGAACAEPRLTLGGDDSDAGSRDADSTGFLEGGAEGGNAGGCSGDLHDVIDANGNVIMTCPNDQGCANGACVPACQAAAMSRGSVGCDFFVPEPILVRIGQANSNCFAAFVANNWPRALHITASLGGIALDPTKFGRIATNSPDWTTWPAIDANGVTPDHVGVLFLADPDGTCKVPAASANDTSMIKNAVLDAFHLVLDTPANVYDMAPFGGAPTWYPGASLIYPTSAWGKNVIAAVTQLGGSKSFSFYTSIWPWGQLVAAEDQTHVQIVPTFDLPAAGSVAAAPKNVVTSFMLGAGQVVQWVNTSTDQANWMSGSVVLADKPVMFTGGAAQCTVSADNDGMGSCDDTHQQIPPVNAWGSEYVAAPYATRRADLADESVQWRIVGAVDGTMLAYDPPNGGPPIANRGDTLDFEVRRAFVVKSQDASHPFYLGVVMTECSLTAGSRPGADPSMQNNQKLGDPDHVNTLPPKQFLSSYTFFSDPTYATTNFVLVRTKGANDQFSDVSVDCLGVVGGWKPVGSSGRWETTNVDIMRAFKPVGSCANGPHNASSKAPFGLTVWGLDSASSYGYPAGGNAAVINAVVVPPVPK